ncbi:MAG: chemotaxis protein CheY [Gammaproteobacteria bacterium]|nr:chemotaxis protein CheY [Gammaproteobacteria bacterium]
MPATIGSSGAGRTGPARSHPYVCHDAGHGRPGGYTPDAAHTAAGASAHHRSFRQCFPSAFPEDAARCRAAGATEFIAKPIEQETLLRALGEHLGLSWIYGELEHGPEVLSVSSTDDLCIASAEEMHVLHQLAPPVTCVASASKPIASER